MVVTAGAGSSSPPDPTGDCKPGDRMLSFSVGGVSHEALLHVPRGVQEPIPLMLAFHGAYDDARGTSVYYGFSKLADREHFIVALSAGVARQVLGAEARAARRRGAVRALLNRMERASCIDSSRVYATGVSNGGGFTARLACEMADRLAAIAPVAGGYDPLRRCKPARPLPLLEIHGTDDDVVPYEGTGEHRRGSDSGFLSVSGFLSQWTQLDGCRGAPKQCRPRGPASRTRPGAGARAEAWSSISSWRAPTTGGRAATRPRQARIRARRHDPTGVDSAEEVWDFLSRFRLP